MLRLDPLSESSYLSVFQPPEACRQHLIERYSIHTRAQGTKLWQEYDTHNNGPSIAITALASSNKQCSSPDSDSHRRHVFPRIPGSAPTPPSLPSGVKGDGHQACHDRPSILASSPGSIVTVGNPVGPPTRPSPGTLVPDSRLVLKMASDPNVTHGWISMTRFMLSS